MNGITQLQELISSMKPTLARGEFVFVTLPGATYGDALLALQQVRSN